MEKKWRITGFVDCHCHLADPRLSSELEGMVERAKAAGVESFIAGGVGPLDWHAQLAIARKINLLPVFGLHPYWVSDASKEDFDIATQQLEALLPEALALGEIGLDFRSEIAKGRENWQRECFRRQWQMARDHDKVAVLHLVRCHEEPLPDEMLPRGALVHAFNSNREVAKKYLERGFYLSIGGPLLRANNKALNDAVDYAPLSQLLVESDTPDQAPPQFKDRFNEPATILLVAQRVAEIKGLTQEAVLAAVKDNILRLFPKELEA